MTTPGAKSGIAKGIVVAIACGSFLAGCVGGCTFGVVTSSDSSSSSREDRFMRALNDDGVTIPQDTAVRLANEACNTLRRAPNLTRSEVVLAASIRQNLPPQHAATFVGASIGAYCPEFTDRPWD